MIVKKLHSFNIKHDNINLDSVLTKISSSKIEIKLQGFERAKRLNPKKSTSQKKERSSTAAELIS